jgi:hypothetical protein
MLFAIADDDFCHAVDRSHLRGLLGSFAASVFGVKGANWRPATPASRTLLPTDKY